MVINNICACQLLLSRIGSRYRAIWEALTIGLLLGIADCFYAGDGDYAFFGYLAGGVLLGIRQAGRASSGWLLLGVSLYAVHVVAIACGRKPPYVEENYRFAEHGLRVIMSSGVGIMAGAGIRVALSTFGWFHRRSGPPVRFLPRTTRDIIITVAYVAISMGLLNRMMFPPTIYSAGYNEARFHAIRKGMTRAQVISILGEPIEKQPWSNGLEKWAYSIQYTYTNNYERRWIIFNNGLVQDVDSSYWID